ncbi:transposase [Spirillospora sp. NBC_00431]
MARTVKRAYKYRFYPTPEQADELARTFGCVRLVYNKALEERSRAYATEGRRVSYAQTSAMLTAWKRAPELVFLGEVSSVPLQQALRHLHAGFVNFFAKRAGYPAFKSREKSRRSAGYTWSAFRWRDGTLTLAKMDGPLDIVWSRRLPGGAEPSTVTVSQDAAGRWFVSLLVEEKITNPRHERRDRRKLAKVQQALSRKVRGSKNRAKARHRVARVHARITDRRRDFPHKLTTRLVRENQTVVIEDLTVGNMLGNRSKLCGGCGTRQDVLPLGVRSWSCGCGAVHDRDVNAARNILAAGPAER